MHRPIRSGGLALVATALMMLGVSATPVDAQIFKRVKQAAERAAERETERQVDRAVTETIRCAIGDSACAEQAQREGKKVEVVDANGNVVSGNAASAAGASAASGSPPAASAAFLNFDFKPGENVLFADDFTRDNVGDFPRRLEFVKGNMEIAEWQGSRWLRATSWPS